MKYGPSNRFDVKLKTPEVTGAIEKRAIQKIVRQHSGELRRCYEKAYIGDTNKASGIVHVAWDITPQGTVDKITIKDSDLKKEVENCIYNSLKQWHFPSKQDSPTHVEFPFEFEFTR